MLGIMTPDDTTETDEFTEPRRWVPFALGLGIALLLLGLGLFAVPAGAYSVAKSHLEADACSGAIGDPAPTDRWYSAHSILDSVSSLPWFESRALSVSINESLACMRSFTATCGAIRDSAIDTARDQIDARANGDADARAVTNIHWSEEVDEGRRDSFCDEWDAWFGWVVAQGLDPYTACPICATRPSTLR